MAPAVVAVCQISHGGVERQCGERPEQTDGLAASSPPSWPRGLPNPPLTVPRAPSVTAYRPVVTGPWPPHQPPP